MNTDISLLCPSNRPADLDKWLSSLHENCARPDLIELSLVTEQPPAFFDYSLWGNVVTTIVEPKQYPINDLVHIAYKQSTSPYIFLSGDDTICHTKNWDELFRAELKKFPDQVVLVYPDDGIFGKALACYPVTSRVVMDKMPFPLDYKRYAVDDTIFDIVPKSRRVYLPNVLMEHLHLVDQGPGVPVNKNGNIKYYPINTEIMEKERPIYKEQQPRRDGIRKELEQIAGIKQKVMIGLSTMEFARKADFYDSFNTFSKPPDTFMSLVHGQSPARARNTIIRQAIDNDCTHIFFVDDDVVIPPDGLMKLLAHDVDIVSGLYLMRNHPHQPIAFDKADDRGLCSYIDLNSYNTEGLIPIVGAGLGCLLVKTDVFKNMKEEASKNTWIRLGELEPDMWCDDLGWFFRVRKLGYTAYLDPTVFCGHQASMTIWPVKHEGQIKISYDTGTSRVTV